MFVDVHRHEQSFDEHLRKMSSEDLKVEFERQLRAGLEEQGLHGQEFEDELERLVVLLVGDGGGRGSN